VAIVVGTTIGSGIFLVPKAMVQNVGTPAMVFAVWIVGGLLALFGALTAAELAASMPEAGGGYVYLREAYGPFWGFVYGWTMMWVGQSGSVATLGTGFFYYLANFFPSLDRVLYTISLPIGPGGGPLEIRSGQLAAIGVIMLLAVVNYFGVRFGGAVQVAVTIVKISLIFAIICIGIFGGVGSAANYRSAIPAAGGFLGFSAALVAALWAYDGWFNLTFVGSEIKNPRRNLPISLTVGTAVVIGIYVITNLAYFYVLPASQVASSDRVAAEMMRKVLGAPGAAAVSLAAMISIFAALNGSILSGSRIPYALAKDGLFFRPVARVHPRYRTPGVSILAVAGWGCVLVLSGRYEQLYTMVIFAIWILYAMNIAAVMVLRRKRPDMPRPYRVPGYPIVPVLFVTTAIALLFSTLVDSPRESLMGLALILIGVPFYFHWKRRGLV
jgi:APA family basic amino acid/polyamine antiporter